ncbi:aminophospholipid transporter, putative [Plasmodium malariae]|uniref:Aminophospholipid transporter, putative n=1 Tax=Plasmodium malariae TaxID=5858 RepID=A0A1C3L142_PLAMA|nr:aminophospholipid transporter, putative [Plasmodium malariae]
MNPNTKDIAVQIQKERKKNEYKIAKELKNIIYTIKKKASNFKIYVKSDRRNCLYYDDDKQSGKNKKNIYIAALFSPILSFLCKKMEWVISILFKFVCFFYISKNKRSKGEQKRVSKELGKNKAILKKNNFDRCIFLNKPTDNLSNKHIIEICKNYLSNTVHCIHNIEDYNTTTNYKECNEIKKTKETFVKKINNLKAFNPTNNLYISDESLIKKIMITEKDEEPYLHNKKEKITEKNNIHQINIYDQQFVKAYYTKNYSSFKNNNNISTHSTIRSGPINNNNDHICAQYKSRHHFIFQVLLNRFKNLYFLILSIFFLLQQIHIFRSNNYLFVAASFYTLFILSAFKEIHNIAKKLISQKGLNGKKYKRVGDILYLEEGEETPADMILLKSGKDEKKVFVSSRSLDGNTDLKIKKCLKLTSHLPNIYDIFRLKIKVMIERPHKYFNKMNGLLIFLNYSEFVHNIYNDLISLQKTFYKNMTSENDYYNEIFNYLIEDTYIERAYACLDFLIRNSLKFFERKEQLNNCSISRCDTLCSDIMKNSSEEEEEEEEKHGKYHSSCMRNSTSNMCCEEGAIINCRRNNVNETCDDKVKPKLNNSSIDNNFYVDCIKRLYSYSICNKRKEDHSIKYEEKIGIENMLWCSSTIIRGNIYGLVAYTGCDKKTSITISNKNTIPLIENNVKCKFNMFLIIIFSLSMILCLLEEHIFEKNTFVIFLNYFFLLFSYIPYVNNVYTFIMSRRLYNNILSANYKMEKAEILNYDIIDEFCNTSFLLCAKTGTLTKDNLKLKRLHFLFDEFVLDGSSNYDILFFKAFLELVDFSLFMTPSISDNTKNELILRNANKKFYIENMKKNCNSNTISKGKNNNNTKWHKRHEQNKRVLQKILSYTRDEINKIFLTFLCILFCNSTTITNRKKKKVSCKSQDRRSSFSYSKIIEENLLINFLKYNGMHVLHTDESNVVIGIYNSMDKQNKIKNTKKKKVYADFNKYDYKTIKKLHNNKNSQRGRKKYMYFKNSLQKENIFKFSNVADKVGMGVFKCRDFGVREYMDLDSGNDSCTSRKERSTSSSSGRCSKTERYPRNNDQHCTHYKWDEGSRNNNIKMYNFEILDHVQFDYHNQMVCSLISYNGKIFNLIKSSYEKIIVSLTKIEDKKKLAKICKPYFMHGHRILVFAYKEITQDEYDIYVKKNSNQISKKEYFKNIFNKNMKILSIITFKEEIQENAKKCIDIFKKANIKTWVLSGDSKENIISVTTTLNLVNANNFFCYLNKKKLIYMLSDNEELYRTLSNNRVCSNISCYDSQLSSSLDRGLIIRRKTSDMGRINVGSNYCNSTYRMIKPDKKTKKIALVQSNSYLKTVTSPSVYATNKCSTNSACMISCITINGTNFYLNNIGQGSTVSRNSSGSSSTAEKMKTPFITENMECAKEEIRSIFEKGATVDNMTKRKIFNSSSKKCIHEEQVEKLRDVLKMMLCKFNHAFTRGGIKWAEKGDEKMAVKWATKRAAKTAEKKGKKRSVQTEPNERYAADTENVVYIVKGDIIDYYLKYEEKEFIKALQNSRCVLFYRCNAIQKGMVARCLKNNTTFGICSIGNNVKDFNMFNESDISIIINNSNKNICNLYAHIKISCFEDLATIFFLYGNKIYINFNSFLKTIYYRGSSLMFLQFYFSYFFKSRLSIFSNISLLWYFLLFSTISVITIILSQNNDINYPTHSSHINVLRKNAMIYKHLKQYFFSLKGFFKVLCVSLYQASLLFLLSYYFILDLNYEIYALTTLFLTHLLHSLFLLNNSGSNFIILVVLYVLFVVCYFIILVILNEFHFIYFYINSTFFINVIITTIILNLPSIAFYLYKKCTSEASLLKHINSFQSLSSKNHHIFNIDSCNFSLENFQYNMKNENIFSRCFRVFSKK